MLRKLIRKLITYYNLGSILLDFFFIDGKFLYGDDYLNKISKNKDVFDSVEIGKTKRLNIHFLDFGNVEWAPFWSINFRNNFSIHFTKDGYKITFEYDEDGYVKNKKVEMI